MPQKSEILNQLDGMWEKICALVVLKAGPQNITLQDIQDFQAKMEKEGKVFFTHGHRDSIELMVIPIAEAEERARKAGLTMDKRTV